MELTPEQKREIVSSQLLELAKGYYSLKITAQACRDSGDPDQAETAKNQMEKLLKRQDSLEKQLSEIP